MPWPLRMTLYTSALVLFILIYLGIRVFRGVKHTRLQPAGLYYSLYLAVAFLLLSYPITGFIQHWLTGDFSMSDYPIFFIYIFWFGVVFTGLMFSWLVLFDLLELIIKKVFKIDPPELDILFAWTFFGITGLVVLYAGGKMIWHTTKIEIEEITYNLPDKQGAEIDPITIVHITDLQADLYTGTVKMERYIKKVNEAEPDIVIFTGDLITSGTEYIEAGARAIGLIEATSGVFAVIGDHDFWSDKDIVALALMNQGITVLQDENIWIEHGETSIKLTGITEVYSQNVDSILLRELLEESHGEDLSILGSHQATDRLINAARDFGVDQLLAGHTHGGQIRVPVFFYPLTAVMEETAYVSGHWQLDDMLLNINNGLGFTLAPVRYNAPAQVSVITVD